MNSYAVREAAATLIAAFGAEEAAKRFGIGADTIRGAAKGKKHTQQRCARSLLDAANAVRVVQAQDAERMAQLSARQTAEAAAALSSPAGVVSLAAYRQQRTTRLAMQPRGPGDVA